MKIDGLMARIGDRHSGGHHPWLSRDYEDIDCRAAGCMFCVNGKCATPSNCKINEIGSCVGFVGKKHTKQTDGD